MMKRGSAVANAAALALVVAGMCTCVPAAPPVMFAYREIRGQLPKNGLRFIVMPDPTTQLVEVDVRYEVGSREDPPGKAGLAHLVEHLMFEKQPGGPGTPTLMELLLPPTLNLNAYTDWDSTHFMVNARAELLDSLVTVEAARMLDGCATISEDRFFREREVVRNEIRSRNRSAEALIPQLTLSAIYPPGHAYAQMVGGNDEQLSAITLRDVCEFTQRYYVPERAVVVLAGGFTADRAIRSIENWFNRLDKRTPAPRRVVQPLVATGGRTTVQLDIERPWVTVAWPLPDERTPEGQAAQFGIWAAFRYMARIADKYDCATQSVTQTLGGREAPILVLALELGSLSKLDECLDRVWDAARDAGYSWDPNLRMQLDEAKNRRKAEFLSSLEPLFGAGGRTDQIADMAQFSRDVGFVSGDIYVFHELDKIGKLDGDKVVAAMKRVLDRDRAKVTVFAPSRRGASGDKRSNIVFHAAADEHLEPAVDPSEAQRPLRVPKLNVLSRATRFQLDNGMHVVLLPVDAMPVVAAQLIFDAGEGTTPDQPGLATTAAELLRLPPGSTTAWQAGIDLRCSATTDHTICAARGVSLYADAIISTLEQLIRHGGYPDTELSRWQRLTRGLYERKRTRQRLAFELQQLAAIYGPEHPYTRTAMLAPSTIDKIGEQALTSFRREHYTAANATLVIAGMFDLKHTEWQVREAFGHWSPGRKDAPVPPAAQSRTAPVHIGVIGDDDPQVDIALLYPSPPGIAGEQAARLVLMQMLDEQMRRIRTELGATYGVHVRRDTGVSGSAYHIQGAVDAPRSGEALRAMRAGIEALRSGTEFDAMFVRARRKVVQELLNGSTVSTVLAQRLGQSARFGLGPSFDNDLLRDAAALSPPQVKQLLARELDPGSEVIVLLGDRGSVTRAFPEAGIDDAKLMVSDR